MATYMVVTYPREFLEPTEVPIGLVRQAVKEFVLSGGRGPPAWSGAKSRTDPRDPGVARPRRTGARSSPSDLAG
ncbi:hypothetical protein ACFQ1I_42535 [Kitasatospora arboriphila]